jgi:hypothetical protein
MNRREFLKSLAAIGTSLAINPAALAEASTAEIDTAWQELIDEPRVFYVGEYGAISSSFGVDYPTSRMDLLGLDYPPKDSKALVEYIESDSVIECQSDFLFECASDADEVGDAETWKEWIEGDPDAAYGMAVDLEKWVADHPDESDWERADLNGLSGRGDALQFFDGQRELAEQFNIAIVWGDHPGSSYYAAELRMDIAEANAIAEAQGLPIRFDWDEA